MKADKSELETRYLGTPDEITPMPPRATGPLDEKLPWVIEFRVVGTAATIRVEVREAMIIGRRDTGHGITPDVDLTPYKAQELGVSRQHAVILAPNNRINIKDLNSANGTRLNGYALTPGREYRLRSGDELTLGQLRLQVRFEVVPTYRDTTTDPKVSQVAIPQLGAGQHVLVVEDDDGVASVFRMTLEYAGFKVSVAKTGIIALGLITHQVPDAIVFNPILPDMDGLDLARYVRKQHGESVPLIAVSDTPGNFYKAQALGAGANVCLSKPVSVDELVQSVCSLLKPDNAAAPSGT